MYLAFRHYYHSGIYYFSCYCLAVSGGARYRRLLVQHSGGETAEPKIKLPALMRSFVHLLTLTMAIEIRQ